MGPWVHTALQMVRFIAYLHCSRFGHGLPVTLLDRPIFYALNALMLDTLCSKSHSASPLPTTPLRMRP